MKSYSFNKSTIEEIQKVLDSHIKSLSFPMDSYLEELLVYSEVYSIKTDNRLVGYASIKGDYLCFFHVVKNEFVSAPLIFERFVKEKQIKRIQAMTQDPLLMALIAEWEYKKSKGACWFIDGGKKFAKEASGGKIFREATLEDLKLIEEKTEGFFDSPRAEGTLEKRIEKKTIFVLLDENDLLGCGIIERGIFFKECVSIGMFVVREHRKKGVGHTILLKLKEWAYLNNLKPIAGCWYYNTLSRKTLEKAGMIAASRGFDVELLEKETLPVRTGNPPGELV